LLNALKGRRKSSRVTIADIDIILELFLTS
jgi:hypothetical protein